MAGIARLAREQGNEVGGCDANIYPPMDRQLKELGITVDIDDGSGDALSCDADCFIIGNALSRGHSLVERVLREHKKFYSAPAWLRSAILRDREVLAVAGTHGKTTTTSMLAHILAASHNPGFLIGGIACNFDSSARLGEKYFVIEADEYDTAFFDKRPKFMHYFPHVLILNNLDYDHADIFADIEAIKTQFSYLLRTVAGDGMIVWNIDDDNLNDVMARAHGGFSSTLRFGESENADWRLLSCDGQGDTMSQTFTFSYAGEEFECVLKMPGKHNAMNALAACAAAQQVGVAPHDAIRALASFTGVRRRLEKRAQGGKAVVYDDFAHHPRAIHASLEGIRACISKGARIVALFEPRSNTMKLGYHNADLSAAFANADRVLCYSPQGWSGASAFDAHADAKVYDNEQAMWEAIQADVSGTGRDETHYVVMSNGDFFGFTGRLATAVEKLKKN